MRSLVPITIRSGAWETLQDAVSDVRRTVFVKEQGILPENEFDDTDPVCTHFAAFDDAGPSSPTPGITVFPWQSSMHRRKPAGFTKLWDSRPAANLLPSAAFLTSR